MRHNYFVHIQYIYNIKLNYSKYSMTGLAKQKRCVDTFIYTLVNLMFQI